MANSRDIRWCPYCGEMLWKWAKYCPDCKMETNFSDDETADWWRTHDMQEVFSEVRSMLKEGGK